jgi:mannose-6-phosphate isomerase-like protein (cupin superfamily)
MAIDNEAPAAMPGTDTVIWLWGDQMVIKAHGVATGGAYAVLEYTALPGHGAGRHVHQNEEETFYILEGALTFHLNEEQVRAPAGQLVRIPRGLYHAFVNAEPEPLRALIILTPAGLENYFVEMGTLARQYPDGPPRETALAIARKYNVIF